MESDSPTTCNYLDRYPSRQDIERHYIILANGIDVNGQNGWHGRGGSNARFCP